MLENNSFVIIKNTNSDLDGVQCRIKGISIKTSETIFYIIEFIQRPKSYHYDCIVLIDSCLELVI